MHVSSSPSSPDRDPLGDDAGVWRRLVHRWFVQYNPLYLLSAALVLGGCFLLSRGLAGEASLAGPLGIAAIGEVYAASLVAGAALLTRIGLRRPAVMLALLFVLYQWDITLHTETCAYLGAAGGWATAAWLAIFVAKIYALGWALRVRFARHVVAAAIVAAIGLALGPRVLPGMGARGAGACVAIWAFALGALHREGGIASLVPLDGWGDAVLRRATRASWLLSGGLVGVHVLFWWRDHALSLASVLPVVPLLLARRVRSEARAWAIVTGTLVVVAAALPSAFFVTALLVAAALAVRALSPAFAPEPTSAPPAEAAHAQPYRAGGAQPAPPSTPIARGALVGPAERARALAGAVFAVYLSAWTLHWSGGPWPAHVLALDLALTAAVGIAVWRARVRSAVLPLGACYLHFVVQARLVPPPRTHVEWGATAVALGFVLLAGSLATSYRLRAREKERET